MPFVDGNGKTSIATGGIAISSPSFQLTDLPDNRHYCLITIVQTPTHPVTIPAHFASNAAFASWVQTNPAVGWRNITHHPKTVTQMIRIYNFANLNPTSQYFHFRIVGRGFVADRPLKAQCTDQSCPINEDLTLPAPDINGNQITGFDMFVPAVFSDDLTITVTSETGSFPEGATLTITYFQYWFLRTKLR